jgi:hypothetical protein
MVNVCAISPIAELFASSALAEFDEDGTFKVSGSVLGPGLIFAA